MISLFLSSNFLRSLLRIHPISPWVYNNPSIHLAVVLINSLLIRYKIYLTHTILDAILWCNHLYGYEGINKGESDILSLLLFLIIFLKSSRTSCLFNRFINFPADWSNGR